MSHPLEFNFLSSLKVRITLAVVVAVLICIWAFAFLVAGRQEIRLRDLLATQQQAVLGYVAENIDNVIRLRRDSLSQVAATIPVARLGERDRMIEFFAVRPVLMTLFNSGVILARPDGRGAFADYPPLPGRSDVDFRGLDSFENVLFDGKAAMGRPFRGRFLDKPVVTFAAPVMDDSGGMAAVLIGITTLDAPNFLDLIAKRLPEGGGDMVVAAPQYSLFVTGTDPSFMLQPLPVNSGNYEMFERIKAGFEGTVVSDRFDGVERLVSVRQIPAASWVVVARLPTEQAFAPVREQRRFVLAGAAALSVLVGLLATVILRRALGPLGRAADRLDAISQGRAPLAPLPEVSQDEVGRLLRSFNRFQEQLAEEAKALRLAASVFENTHEGVTVTDAKGTILDVNPAFCDITGYSREEAVGQTPRLLKSGRQNADFYEAMWQAISHRGHWRGEIWNRRKDGEIYPELLTISAVRDESGVPTHYVAVFSDISHIKQHQRQLETIAHFDALTGLANRLLLSDRMRQAIAQAQRAGHLLGVCYLDLDNFKPINDKLGHEAGDRLLLEVASRLKSCVRAGDTVARLGGDEFVLLLTELERIHECEVILDRVREAVAEPCVIADRAVAVSASIGFTIFPMDEADPDTLLRHADLAMYTSKQSGRNCYVLFDAEHDRRTRARHEALHRIENALARGEFVLHYQPQVDLRRGIVIGAEALIRWQDPERGLLRPDEFLPDIEHHDLIVSVGEWVVKTALSQLAEWRAEGLELKVCVNLAARHLQRDDFVARLRELLAAHPEIQTAGSLELEMVESTAIEDMSRMPGLIAQCRELGVDFALDDFGTGYSSLTYFKMLPAGTLKIDQSFIRDMLKDPDDLAIVEGVIGLAEVFRRRVIAEGVESVAHGIALLGMGCQLAQGYGIARPMPGSAFAGWARNWRPDPAWAAVGLDRWRRDDIQLLVAENNHRSWVGAIVARLAGIEEGESPEIDPHACRFGQWYDTIGRIRHGQLAAFGAIDAVHRRVHEVGAAALELRAQGRQDEASAMLPELFRLREELVANLHALQSSVDRKRTD